MRNFFITLVVLAMAICANAQKNQYIWYQGNLMMGNPIAQIDSVTFGENEPTDTLHILLPRTNIQTIAIHDTVNIIVRDTVYVHNDSESDYVDLGLPSGNKWANRNLGALNSYDYGDWYFWGGLSPLNTENIVPNNTGEYRWADVGYTTLSAADDVATQTLGENWKIPTRDDFQELVDNCIWQWMTINNILGFSIKGPSGDSIFLPANGYYWDGCGLCHQNGICLYWTSNNEYYDSYAINISVNGSSTLTPGANIFSRDLRITAQGIRPVYIGKSDAQTHHVHDTIYIRETTIVHDTIYVNIPCPNDSHDYGVLNGLFSVSPTKKVRFSKGNLQFNPSLGSHNCADGTTKQGTWRFAENQWNYVGYCDGNRIGNVYIHDTTLCCNNWSQTYDGWIDQFGWGVTGYNGVEVWDSRDVWGNKYEGEGNLDNTYYDWGIYNAISNGGNQPGLWRTLSKDEWNYLLTQRDNATIYTIKCLVNSIQGTIILPDNWGEANIPSMNSDISLTEWEQLELMGAVFFPVNKRAEGRLWSTTNYSQENAWIVQSHWFENFVTNKDYKATSQGVRLVQDVEE